MSGFGAIIVTFNPNINILKDNISSVINQVDTIVVLDNGSSNVKNIELLVKDINDDMLMINGTKLNEKVILENWT